MHRRRFGILLVALAASFACATSAAALPANPWTGRWLVPGAQNPTTVDQVITLTQIGSTITGTFPFCGGGTYDGTVSADDTVWTGRSTHAPGPPGCSSTGQATFTATLRADGRSFSASGVTVGFGSPFTFSATYVDGGTEPRDLSLLVSPRDSTGTVGLPHRLVVARVDTAGTIRLPAPGGTEGVTYTVTRAGSSAAGAPGFAAFGPDGRAAITLQATSAGTETVTLTSDTLSTTTTVRWVTADLQRVIPSPATVTGGPTRATFPGRISLGSLKKSRCVRVVAVSNRRASVLVSIFSGRRSLRLFGQKDVRFFDPGRKVVCIPVPRRARTFNVRTPLRFALGWRLGTTPRTFGPRNRPIIRPIRLAP